MKIVNENKLLGEIRRIVQEELKVEYPNNQITALWKFINAIDERLKCVEKQNSDSVETMISKYLTEKNKKKDEEKEK